MRLDKEAWRRLLRGATLYGCGGGSSHEAGRKTVRRLLKGRPIRLARPAELKAQDLAITVYKVGALSTGAPRKGAAELLKRWLDLYQTLFGGGRRIAGIMPGEIGPGVIAECGAACAALGIPMLDTDVVGGRSVPEITNELFSVFRRRKAPLVCGSYRGNALILDQVPDADLEARCRAFYQAEGKNIWVIGYGTPVGALPEFLPIGTVSACIELSRQLEQGLFAPFQPVFEGRISKVSLHARAGFDWGTCRIKGVGGSVLVHIKNENMVLALNGKLFCTVPDLIVLYSEAKGRGLASTELTRGAEVVVLCAKADRRWRTKRAVRFFNPRQQGFDFDVRRLT